MPNQSDLPVTSGNKSGFERVRVDVAQTSFFEGREFSLSDELNIPSSGSRIYKIVSPHDFVIWANNLHIESGHARMSLVYGGTEGGTFTPLTLHSTNGMSLGTNRRRTSQAVGYAAQITVAAGGTLTGGTERDILRLKAGNVTVQATSVTDEFSERGFAAGTYYLRLTNLSITDPITGVLFIRWEERPASM